MKQQPSPQEERQALMQMFIVAKRRYYNFNVGHVLGPKNIFPVDIYYIGKADNFFRGESTSQNEHGRLPDDPGTLSLGSRAILASCCTEQLSQE